MPTSNKKSRIVSVRLPLDVVETLKQRTARTEHSGISAYLRDRIIHNAIYNIKEKIDNIPNKKVKSARRHDILQHKAYIWLRELGYTCSLEAQVSNGNHGWYYVDVCGRQDKNLVIIECGNTPTKKLDTLSRIASEVYIWRFGQESPEPYPDEP
jgi:hypothetical protein